MRLLKSALVGALTLVALQVFVSGQGPEKGGQLLGWINTGLQKAISPKVAAIPTAGKGKPAATVDPKKKAADDYKNGPIGLGTNPDVNTVQV